MNKGDLIYLKMSNGDRVFLNANEIIAVLVSYTAKDNSDNDNSISTETFETKLDFCMSNKTLYSYEFDDNDPDGMAVMRQIKNFVSEEAFK